MRTTSPPLRLLAVVMVVVVLVTLATPARADAEVLTTVGIVMLAVAGVIIIAYLIIAAASDYRRGDQVRLDGEASVALVQVTESP